MEILKISRRGSSSPDNAEFGLFTFLQRTAKKCTKNYNGRAQPLFSPLNLLFHLAGLLLPLPSLFS